MCWPSLYRHSADRTHWRVETVRVSETMTNVTTNNGDQHSLNIHNIPFTDETKDYFPGVPVSKHKGYETMHLSVCL